MRRLLLLFVLLPLLAACAGERRYDVRGRVVGFGDDGRTVIVAHEDVEGFMPGMTMPFRTRAALPALEFGDAIGFRLHVSREASWISGIHPVPDSTVAPVEAGVVPGTPDDAVLEVGDLVPPASLVDETGQPFTLADFRGQTLVVDFIYSRCPLPDYCILLSNRFAALQQTFADDPDVQLLSITLDPTFDTPEVLRAYRDRYTDRPEGWRFGTGTEAQVSQVWALLGQYVIDEEGTLQHNLVTAVIGPDGRVARYFRGQGWTVEDVAAAVREARP